MQLTGVLSSEAAQYGSVAVLCGGPSTEREVSLVSGKRALEALLAYGINAQLVDLNEGFNRLKDFDRVFIALHGTPGEDGRVQGTLDLMGIPYTGSGALASALAINKEISKIIFNSENLPTLPSMCINSIGEALQAFERLGACAVKPLAEGSSVGISLVEDLSKLPAAYALASKYSNRVMLERLVKGSEYTVSIVHNMVLPSIKIVVPAHKFYDYEYKYSSEDTQYLFNTLTEQEEQELAEICLQAYKALGCKDLARIDLMRDANGKFYILELNTIPGLTSHSLLPMAAKQVGVDFTTLIVSILAGTLQQNSLELSNKAMVGFV